ncbi:MAG: MlaD family protein [Planctomycetota bacterium]
MAKKRTNELTAGLFVIVTLGVTLGVVLWIGAAEMFRPSRQTAYFYVDPSAGSLGLNEGSAVLIGDAPIGKITEVRYDASAGRTVYRARIERDDVRIRSDARATVSLAMLGTAQLVIKDPGSTDSPPADAAHAVPVTGGMTAAFDQLTNTLQTVGSLAGAAHEQFTDPEALIGKLNDVAAQAQTIASRVAAEVDPNSPDSVMRHVKNISRRTDRTIVPKVAGIAEQIQHETDRESSGSLIRKAHGIADEGVVMAGNVREATADIKAITTDARPKVSKILSHAQRTAGQMEKDLPAIFARLRQANDKILKVANDLSDVSGATREIVVLNRHNIDHMIENMTRVSESLKATAAEIRRSPWRLLRKPDREEVVTYDILTAAGAFAQGAASLDRALAKLETLQEEPAADDAQVKQIRAHLAETFAKFKAVEDALWKQMQK